MIIYIFEKSVDVMKALFILSFVIAAALMTISSFGQRNLVDVPSSDIVEKGRMFMQFQFGINKDEIQGSAVGTYGLGYGFEMGWYVHQGVFGLKEQKGFETDPQDKPENTPDFMVNLQKGFNIQEWFKVGIGTRLGTNARGSGDESHFVYMNYLNTQFSIPDSENKLVIGAYHADRQYAGENTVGLMAGIEAELIKEKVNILSDFYSGKNALSVWNTGLQFSLPKNWHVLLGVQVPLPDSDNSTSAVIQIGKD
jgi:hypothetical protein